MSDDDVVMTFENVDFQANRVDKNLGVFSLLSKPSGYVIEWRSNTSTSEAPAVSVAFEQISDFMTRSLSPTEVSVCVILVDSSRLARFVFSRFAHLQVPHFVEYLKFKGLAEPQASRPGCYKVLHKSTRIYKDFNYVPPSQLSVKHANNIAAHDTVLKMLSFDALLAPPPVVTLKEVREMDFGDVKEEVYRRGLDESSRPEFWARALGVTPDNDGAKFAGKLVEYRRLHEQLSLLTTWQKYEGKFEQMFQIIEYDVKRNDRVMEQFADDDSPNLKVLKQVLRAYAMYNRDTEFVQGMGDLVSPMIIVFIKEWVDGEHALFYDGVTRNMEETECYIFLCFDGMLKMTQQEHVFTKLWEQERFVVDCTFRIGCEVYEPLKDLLSGELSGAPFLFKSFLLLFKRDFTTAGVLRVWDSMFSYEEPHLFPRFFGAAMLILVYPRILLHTDGSVGEVMNAFDGAIERTDAWTVLQLCTSIAKRMDEQRRNRTHGLFDSIPRLMELRDFHSKYFTPL